MLIWIHGPLGFYSAPKTASILPSKLIRRMPAKDVRMLQSIVGPSSWNWAFSFRSYGVLGCKGSGFRVKLRVQGVYA